MRKVILYPVIGIVIVGTLLWVGKSYVDGNYIPKPRPLDAHSVLVGMALREQFYNETINAYQKRDTVRLRLLTEQFTKTTDSLKAAQ